jgi:hypothetical protein
MAQPMKQDLRGRLLKFAAWLSAVVEALPTTRPASHMSDPLARYGGLPLAKCTEDACGDCPTDSCDRVHRVLEKLREVRAHLGRMQQRHPTQCLLRVSPLLAECDALIAIFAASLKKGERDRPR